MTPFVILGLLTTAGHATPPSLTSISFLPGDAALAPAAGKQLMPEIAAGADTYLAVWVDDRTAMTEIPNIFGGPNFDHHIGTMWDLFAARIDADGNLVDESPIAVTQDVQNQAIPVVAWNGTSWLIVYMGQTGLQCCPEESRYAVRVAADGTVLDTTPILVAPNSEMGSVWDVTVGSDGSNWLVVWAAANEVRGMRIAPDGTILDPGGVVLHTGGYPGEFDITYANGEYFLVWSSGGQTSGGEILGLRLASDLMPVAPAFAINQYSPSVARNARVATNGTNYFVTWWEDRYYQFSQLAGARVSATGSVMDPAGVFLTEAWGITNYDPDVVWTGMDWLVLYDHYTNGIVDLFAARVTADGVVLDYDTDALPISTAPGAQNEVTVARLEGADMVVALWRDWQYGGSGSGDIVSATITPDIVVGPEAFIALGAPRQIGLRLASDETGSIAVYLSQTGIESRVLAQRIDAAGNAIDPEPIEVVSGEDKIRNPAVAWNGTEYLVAWEDANAILARRLDSNLDRLGAGPFQVMPGNGPGVAAVGDVFLVVATYENPPEIRRVYSARVRGSDGAVLDVQPHVVGGSYSPAARVAAFSDRWIVTWEQHPTHDNPASSIRANVVGTDGLPGTSYTVSGSGDFPDVAVGASNALVVWSDKAGQTTEDLDIFARRVMAGGTLLDPAPIVVSEAANAQFDVTAAWTGTEYIVAFGDFRNEERYASKTGDIYAARVSADGVVVDPDGFPFANDVLPDMFAATVGGDGSFRIGASVFRREPGYMGYRIAIRATIPVVGVPSSVPPGGGIMLAARPNPARGTADVSFELIEASDIRVAVFDVAGRVVRTIADGRLDAGHHTYTWDGRGRNDQPVMPGVYFVTLMGEQSGHPLRSSERIVLLD